MAYRFWGLSGPTVAVSQWMTQQFRTDAQVQRVSGELLLVFLCWNPEVIGSEVGREMSSQQNNHKWINEIASQNEGRQANQLPCNSFNVNSIHCWNKCTYILSEILTSLSIRNIDNWISFHLFTFFLSSFLFLFGLGDITFCLGVQRERQVRFFNYQLSGFKMDKFEYFQGFDIWYLTLM